VKSKINVRKDPDGVSFLQEVIAHMDWKLKKGNVKVIPELAKIFLPVDQFDSIDIHSLSRDFKKRNPTSTSVLDFLCFCEYSMTEELCNEVAKSTSDQTDNPLWRRFR
jgi:hypothetical protein